MSTTLCVRIGHDELPAENLTTSERLLRTAVEESLPPGEIADAIGMPQSTVIRYELSSDGRLVSENGVVRVKFLVRAAGEASDLLSSNVEADVGDFVLARLDGLRIPGLSGQTNNADGKVAELRLEVSDSLPRLISSAELASKAGFEPGRILGWSKGCNSWPW
jgi:hypothetical protein